MLRLLVNIIKWIFLSLAGVLLLVLVMLTYLYFSADMGVPKVEIDRGSYNVELRDTFALCGGSTLRYNNQGIWELTTQGDAVQRGAESGALLSDLLNYQEYTFVDQIRRIVPSDSYLRFLRVFIQIFNRDMAASIPEEYRTEIYALSHFSSDRFDAFGTPYERQLNYHAAHDIGHTMQEYMLVGCSSFAVWGDQTADSTLLVGRNFDFWVGDDFARNKLVTFCTPDQGYAFASVGWAGMIGVLSGMNSEGLTVTLNAAKGAIPLHAAMPISLLARDILQYAATIDQAYSIAQLCNTFVSESLLIASANDRRAAIIEKTPTQTALFSPEGERVVCTNHYQSTVLGQSAENLENIATTDSEYRFIRLEELLDQNPRITPTAAVAVLRNRHGLGGADIGVTNQKSINQAIAHHGVVFQPEKGMMWVSTSPWQVGAFVAYDLNKIFRGEFAARVCSPDLAIAADSTFLHEDYPRVKQFRADVAELRVAIDSSTPLSDEVLGRMEAVNPNFFVTWELLGDYYATMGDAAKAQHCWKRALKLEIPRLSERKKIERKVENR